MLFNVYECTLYYLPKRVAVRFIWELHIDVNASVFIVHLRVRSCLLMHMFRILELNTMRLRT